MPVAQQSPFENEWRKCLREHYLYVIQQNDTLTETSLSTVLHRLGFDEAELRDLYMQATLRQDNLKEDFVPDMSKVVQPHPAECTCSLCSPEDQAALEALLETGHDDEGQPLPVIEGATTTPEPEAVGNLFAGIDVETIDPETPEESPAETVNATVADTGIEEDDEDNLHQMSMF